MYRAVAANKRATVIIVLLFLLLLGGLGCLVGYLYDDYMIVAWTLLIAAFYAGAQYFAAGRMAMAINGAHEISKSDNPLLWNTVENLAIAEGLPMPRVFLIEDPAPNAFATGRNPKTAMVAATTGLLAVMEKRELTAVMAHEMGHVKNYDILVSMIVFGLVSAVSLICDIVWRISWSSGRRNSEDRGGYLMLLGLVALVVAPIVALLIQLAISRQREYLADASSALTTRDPDGMVMALEKLRTAGRPMQRQNSSTSHLFFANPLKKGIVGKLFSTHPPLDERIKRLQQNAAKF